MDWHQGVEQLHAEAGGIATLDFVRRETFPALIAAALQGDLHAARLARAVVETLARISAMPRSAPALCGCCPRTLRRAGDFTICVLVPRTDSPTQCMGFALCARCGACEKKRRAMAVEALRRVWPKARPIAIHPTARGHA